MKRLLVLEDEPLIAWGMADEMEDLKWTTEVVGTCYDALRLIEKGVIDAGVLDFNLRGETSEAVARAMIKNGLPFVFVSGAIREAFPDFGQPVDVLTKPIDYLAVDAILCRLQTAPGEVPAERAVPSLA